MRAVEEEKEKEENMKYEEKNRISRKQWEDKKAQKRGNKRRLGEAEEKESRGSDADSGKKGERGRSGRGRNIAVEARGNGGEGREYEEGSEDENKEKKKIFASLRCLNFCTDQKNITLLNIDLFVMAWFRSG